MEGGDRRDLSVVFCVGFEKMVHRFELLGSPRVSWSTRTYCAILQWGIDLNYVLTD